jgi:hypothetical protein
VDTVIAEATGEVGVEDGAWGAASAIVTRHESLRIVTKVDMPIVGVPKNRLRDFL